MRKAFSKNNREKKTFSRPAEKNAGAKSGFKRKPIKKANNEIVFKLRKNDFDSESKSKKETSPRPRFKKESYEKKTGPRKYSSGHSRNLNRNKREDSDPSNVSKKETFQKSGENRNKGFKKFERRKPEGEFEKRNSFKREAENREPTFKKFERRKPETAVKKFEPRNQERRFEKKQPFTQSKKFDKIKEHSKYKKKNFREHELTKQDESIRLNRYIANAGICSRRDADKLITSGLVSVNGEIITELGYKTKPTDDVRFNGERLSREKKIYIVMNKPKDTITTLDDPQQRNTVIDLIGNKVDQRVFPIGRLDRNTTGVLLLTNDGEFAQKLMHPKYEIEKIYKATLDKNFKGEDLWELKNGIELEDGFIKPDEVEYPDAAIKNEVGILIHSGRNRIIHRMFEHLGYIVEKLDRTSYAGFVKTGLKKGEWRHLNDKEVNKLKKFFPVAKPKIK